MEKSDTPVAGPEVVEIVATVLADMQGEGYIFRGRYPTKEPTREDYRGQAHEILIALLSAGDVRQRLRAKDAYGKYAEADSKDYVEPDGGWSAGAVMLMGELAGSLETCTIITWPDGTVVKTPWVEVNE